MERSFKTWLDKRESSAYTRARRQAALGLGPDIFMWSRSTPHPGELALHKKRKKKRKKRNKNMDESKDSKPDYSVDRWLNSVDDLKRALDDLENGDNHEDDELEDDFDLDGQEEGDFDLDGPEDELEDDDELEPEPEEEEPEDGMSEPKADFQDMLSRMRSANDKKDSGLPRPDAI